MGEMLQRNYKVTGDKRGISLIGKANRLWFGPDPEDKRSVIFGIRSIPTIRSNYIAVKINHNGALLCPVSETKLKEKLQITDLLPSVRD